MLRVLAIVWFTSSVAFAAEPVVEKKLPDTLKITVSKPPAEITAADANNGKFSIRMTIENCGKEPITIWPFLNTQIKDAQGKIVEPSMYLGRFGLRFKDSLIESLGFVTLQSGKKRIIPFNTSSNQWEPEALTGWKLEPGEYTAQLKYSYNRADAKKKYGEGCKTLDKKDAPWNLALEVDYAVEVKFRLK